MATVGLCIITQKYDTNIRRIISDYQNYFDHFYLQINGGGKLPASTDNLSFSDFKWCDNFAAARNELLKQVKTDYWMWLDSDDEIVHPEELAEIINYLEGNAYDLVYLPYLGEIDKLGKVKTMYWRERVMRTAHPFYWQEPVHECLEDDANAKVIAIDQSVVIKHQHKSTGSNINSAKRNLEILQQQYQAGDRRTMRLHYLASSYAVLEDYQTAMKFFKLVAARQDAPGVAYDAWLRLAGLQIQADNLPAARASYRSAMKLCPDLPDAYLYLGCLYQESGQPKLAIKWLELGLSKPLEQTFRPTDPAFLTNQSKKMLAQAYLQIGKPTSPKH